MTEFITLRLPVSCIFRNPKIDPREGRMKADYLNFVESIRAQGVLQPILVRPVADDPNFDFEAVFGNTRHADSIDAGKETIPAEIRDMSDEEARLVSCTNPKENQMRGRA